MFQKNFVVSFFLGLVLIGGLVPISYSSENNLSVTPEIEQMGIFYGHQVVEIKVSDPNISETDEAKGEPDVTVNGKIVRMVQATDGNWYGYIANFKQAQIVDSSNTDVNGQNVDFGTFCGNHSTILGIDVLDSKGIAISSQDGINGTDPPTDPIPNCNVAINPDDSMNVLENVPPINLDSPIGPGQIGVYSSAWPFIQIYPVTEEFGTTIQYNVGGGAQVIKLDYLEQFPSAEKLTEDLIFQIQSMDLPSNTESKLLNHLNKILENLEDGNSNNDKNICHSLNTFENQVKSMAGKQISFEQAQNLMDSVEIAEQILCV